MAPVGEAGAVVDRFDRLIADERPPYTKRVSHNLSLVEPTAVVDQQRPYMIESVPCNLSLVTEWKERVTSLRIPRLGLV